MSDTVKVRVTVSTDKVGSDDYEILEYDREEWEAMTDDERESDARDAMFNMIEWNWEIEE